MTISATLVMKLRGMTGAPMMDCKKYLIATNGDIEAAITQMRISGQDKADKKLGRIAAEGIVVIARAPNAKEAVMVEINSETDFVARDENFTTFAKAMAETALNSGVADVATLLTHPLMGQHDMTVEQARQALVAKMGENIQLRHLFRMKTEGVIGSYIHGSRVGVLVDLKRGDEALAKDLAMHIAASRPQVVSKEQVSKEALDHERVIFQAQAQESGKPQEIINKMIEGRISKFIDEVTLLGQPYIKNPTVKVGQFITEKQAEVGSFICLEVGEGIEKKEDNFVEEVMAQVRAQ